MKTLVYINGKPCEVELDRAGKTGTAGACGHFFAYEITPRGVTVNGRPVRYEPIRDALGRLVAISLHGKWIPVEVSRPGEGEASRRIPGEVRAPLNGQVVKLARQDGDRVETGGLVLVLEAMKMENEITSPASGIIRDLHVGEKGVVRAGELLFRVEPEPS